MGDEVGRRPIEPSKEVFDQDLYREGDVVPETGHYVCIFCGFIQEYCEAEEFEACPSGHGLDDACWKLKD
jgi:rubrerythrin